MISPKNLANDTRNHALSVQRMTLFRKHGNFVAASLGIGV